MSISAFMRLSAIAAPGLTDRRIRVANQRRKLSSPAMLGANRPSAPAAPSSVPQVRWIVRVRASISARFSSAGGAHG